MGSLVLEQPFRIALGYLDSLSPWANPPVTVVAIVTLLFIAGLLLRLARWTFDSLAFAVYLALESDPDAAIALSLVLLVVSIGVLAGLRDRWLTAGAAR